MTEEALWYEIETDGEHADFACALLLKERGHVKLPFTILDGSVTESEVKLAWARGLRALGDRRAVRPLMSILACAHEEYEKKVIMTALEGIIDLGGPPEDEHIPEYLLDSDDGDIAGLALMAHLMGDS